jgi:outer membrane protein TolC
MKAKKGMISLVFILYLLNGNHIAAQSIPPDGLLSFDQATDIALRNSHSIKQAAFLKKENQEETKAAKGLRSPNIGLTAGYFLLSDDIHLDLTPVKNAITPLYSALSNYGNFSGVANYPDAVSTQLVRGQLQQGLATIEKTSWDEMIQKKAFGLVSANAMWPIYTGGKINAANAAAGIKEKEADEVMRQKSGELMSELAERYFGLCLAQQAVKVRQEVFDGVDKHLNDALKIEKQGLIAHAEVLNAQVHHAEAARELSKAKHTAEILNEALKNTLALSDATNIHPATELFYLDMIEPVDYFKTMAHSNNPLLQQVQTKKELSIEGYKAELSNRYPSIAMQGSYNILDNNYSPYLPKWMVGVGAKWTLFDGASRDKKIKAASFKTDQVKEAEKKAGDDISTVIDKLYKELQMYHEQLQELATAHQFADEYLRVREKAFLEEMSNETEVVDARLALSKVKIERLEAMYGYDKTLAQLLQYAGIPEQFSAYQKKPGVITESYETKK